MSIAIRNAHENDGTTILKFIQRKAEFDRSMNAFGGEIQTSEAAILQTLFGPQPFARVLIAEANNSPVGFALYYFRYSSFKGRPSLWLDDLYVNETQRSQGIGAALMNRLAEIAIENNCTHIAWTASIHNTRGIKFYERLGAQITERKEHQVVFQVEPHQVQDFLM